MPRLMLEKPNRKGEIGSGQSKDIKGRVDYSDVEDSYNHPFPTVHRMSDGTVAIFLGHGPKLVCLHVHPTTAKGLIQELHRVGL